MGSPPPLISAESHNLQFILNDLVFNFKLNFKFFNVILFSYFWLHWVFAAAGSHSLAAVIGGCSLLVACGLFLFQNMSSRVRGLP